MIKLLPLSIRNKLRPYKHRLQRLGDEIRFNLERNDKRKNIEKYKHCGNRDDFWRFALKHFPPAQHQCEIYPLLDKIADGKTRVACEIGVSYGGTNFLLANAIPELELLVGIDIDYPLIYKLRTFQKQCVGRHFVKGYSNTDQTLDYVRKLLNGRPIDFLLIDGDHSYEGVKSDWTMYSPLVREGGWIAFHDIVKDRKSRGLVGEGYAGEVPRFWSEIKSNYEHFEWIRDPEQDGAGIGLIKYSR